ncbi:odorant receptor 63a-like isoform X2 [Phymastichus coffea]|uniref:odorant receptor 63a-like isoform X2 n=1 Tax=Phymastichus coffea TaxID=108790 RepID=UPI00273C89E9|nr:odorant receptor 63a-like isoform X2 [Phymastichus coffea]
MIQDNRQQIDGDKDFQWAFYLNRIFLTILGVWPSDEKESRLKSLRLPLMFIAPVCGICLPATYALIQVQDQLNLVIDNLLINISHLVAAAKIFLLWYYRSNYIMLIKWSEINWSRCTTSWERQLMAKQASRGRFLSGFSYITIFIHVNGFVWSPVFDLGIRIVNNITDPNPQRYLPVQSYYPYDSNKSPYYELTYFSQIFSICLSSIAYASVDTLFNVLVFHASGQSEILAENMSRLGDRQEHQSLQCKVKELIDSHNELARFVMTIEKSFTVTIFIQLFGAVILVCSSIYACVKAINENSSIKQLSTLVLGAVNVNEHIVIYCLTCEILAANSLEIFNGIYSSKWYNLPAKEARYVTMVLARTRYPLRLSAGKFFYLSMNSYIQLDI